MAKLTIQDKVENYVRNLFLEANTSGLFYHDFNHTLSVVETVSSITKAINLSKEESEILKIAAWFHDVGYLYTRIEHEALSCKVASLALKTNYSSLIQSVTTCIAATKVGQLPENNLVALLKDADIAFGSAYDFIKTNNAYREELRISEKKIYDDNTWYNMSLNFLQNVTFFSNYGKENYTSMVTKNIVSYKQIGKTL